MFIRPLYFLTAEPLRGEQVGTSALEIGPDFLGSGVVGLGAKDLGDSYRLVELAGCAAQRVDAYRRGDARVFGERQVVRI